MQKREVPHIPEESYKLGGAWTLPIGTGPAAHSCGLQSFQSCGGTSLSVRCGGALWNPCFISMEQGGGSGRGCILPAGGGYTHRLEYMPYVPGDFNELVDLPWHTHQSPQQLPPGRVCRRVLRMCIFFHRLLMTSLWWLSIFSLYSLYLLYLLPYS